MTTTSDHGSGPELIDTEEFFPLRQTAGHMRFLRRPFRIIRADLGAYLVMNVIVYGLCLIGMGVGLAFPELAVQSASTLDGGTTELITRLLGNMWLFSLTIFAVNTLTVGLLKILLPSMIVPFAGIGVSAYWAFHTGVMLAPVNETLAKTMIPHSLTVMIEFQAYALLMLGAYLLGRSWLRPRSIGARDRRHGYVRGLQQVGWLSLPALALFVIGAIYEAFELVHVVPWLVAG